MANQLPQTRTGGERPRSGFDLLQQQIDRMFDDFAMGWRSPAVFGGMGQNLLPSIDLHEQDNKVIVTAELPGVKEEDVNISVDDNLLTISGEKKEEIDSGKGDQRQSERIYGRFSRSITLPFDIDPDKVDARFDNGVLTLTVDRPAEAAEKQRRIPIRH
ncbi:MAG TPA: Hsp20/alpha crystallin family protein [Devosiaceae bacterium]|nr:Hsp20/alpha crystallin family protein [Devosiaceae bacterium]